MAIGDTYDHVLVIWNREKTDSGTHNGTHLTHVINFELPTDAQHYVHRAGRCGRAGQPGLVMNFANPGTKFVVRRFGKQLGTKIRDCEMREGQVWLKKT